MAAITDLKSAQALCDAAADAAMDRLLALGIRPADAAAAADWDDQDALLKSKISTLSHLSSSIGAQIVVQALEDVWPQLDELDQVTAAAQASIARIERINRALTVIASVVTFAAAVVEVSTQPTVGNAGKVLTAFKAVRTQIA